MTFPFESGTRLEKRRGGKVLGIHIDAVSWETAIERILDWGARRESRYICVCNVHSVATANQDLEFQEVINNADMATPDGMPIAWFLRMLGFADRNALTALI
jgi:N-acetylglucosaminyldiphosphoundecaprenol N-acetyl-beta-D-mannosaminyltransferase